VSELNTNYLYLIIFALLIGETDIEVNLSSVLSGTTYVAILLGIAATKAIMIAMFYQHLRYEPRSLSSWVILGIVMASILMSLSFVQLTYHSYHITS
jgi:cytochrome c oxidase subunit IV